LVFFFYGLMAGAADVTGEKICGPAEIPESEWDGGERRMAVPGGVLANLAAVWIMTQETGPWASRIHAACEVLTRHRGSQQQGAVKVGRFVGTSHAEALWSAARALNVSRAFGCGPLVDVVRKVFPREHDTDPWDIGDVFQTYLCFAEEDLQAMSRAWAEQGRTPGHLSRLSLRFLGHDLRRKIAKVRVPELCRWLLKAMEGVDGVQVLTELRLEFACDLLPKGHKPRWDRDRRELWYGDTLCLRFRRAAPNQELVLKSFEELAWPDRSDDPLPQNKLAYTIKDMQDRLRDAPIVFERDGIKGIAWRKRI
jgi:hypothetical protein